MTLADWMVLAAAMLIMGLCWWTLAKHDEMERVMRKRELEHLNALLQRKERRDEEARSTHHRDG